MAYDKTNDLNDIQADVLTTDITDNPKISKLKQLKTETKVPTKAINALNEQLNNAQASASDAVQRTVALEETVDQVAQRVTRMETNGGGSAGGASFTVNNDWMRTQVKDVRSWQSMSEPVKTATAVNDLPGYDFSDDVRKFLPSTINNVTFTNTDDEESVKIYWNIDDLSAGDHEYTADYGLGYYSSSKAPTYGLHVYKNIKSYEGFSDGKVEQTENGYEVTIPLKKAADEYLPTAITNVQFTNTDNEDIVGLTFPTIDTTTEKDVSINAIYPAGYCGVDIQILTHVSELDYAFDVPDGTHVYGIVLAEEGNTSGTWERIDQNFNRVEFDANTHNTWKNMKQVSNTYGDFTEIPTTYVRSELLNTKKYKNKLCYWVADGPIDGFHVHPAFLKQDGTPGVLHIGKRAASNNNNILYSTGKAWKEIDYNEVNALGWMQDGIRPYNIYDHHFLMRLLLIEHETSNFSNDTYSGVAYYGINCIFGANYCQMIIDGICCKNAHIAILKNDGSRNMVEIPIVRYSNELKTIYPVTCLLNNTDDYDLGDVFLTNDENTDKTLGSFTDAQSLPNSSTTHAYLNGNGAAFALMSFQYSSSYTMCRASRVL